MPKTSTSDEDSTNNESYDIMPGLQNRNHQDSDNENENNKKPGVDEVIHSISSNNETYHFNVNNNEQVYQHQLSLTNTNSSTTNIWQG